MQVGEWEVDYVTVDGEGAQKGENETCFLRNIA
jgi:hypothetical protein